MIPEQSQHHVANVAATTAPLAAWLVNAPMIVTIVVGLLTAIYYGFLILEKIEQRRMRRAHKDQVG